jgi:hypothetical protein
LQSQQHSFKFGAPKVTLETTKSKWVREREKEKERESMIHFNIHN